ncbi:MAG: Asp-tRNA(Asn)/Glu-tRNA(Gln) amidotransferase subunit GatC [bacterium]|nr:Asp-tRNA(Asn)/Glu-tRNA(Gln) amidotransferase subunit GatC [bacterium]
MALSREETNKLAQLSRIGLKPEEEERFGGQLSSILAYVDMLKKVDTTGVEYEYHVPGLSGVTRADEALPTDETERAEIIDQFPEKKGDVLSVKKIF